MKRPVLFPIVILVCSLAFTLAAALAATPALAGPEAASPAAAAFERLKGLAGNWQGKDPQGNTFDLTYRVASGGSALVEEMGHGNMITVYHLDGDRLMLTHYCQAKNQPRMRTDPIKSGDAKTLDFKFLDVTNLAKPTDSYMRNLMVTFQDADHFSQRWTHSEGGEESPMTLTYERKK